MNVHLSQRQKEILMLLSQRLTAISAEELAQQYYVSLRTIYNDLNAIEQFLQNKFDCKVTKMSRKELLLSDEVRHKVQCLNLQLQSQNMPENQARPLLFLLLFYSKGITVTKLCDLLYISRPTCYSLIRKIQENLEPFGVTIDTKSSARVTLICEKEQVWRNIFTLLIRDFLNRKLTIHKGVILPLKCPEVDRVKILLQDIIPGENISQLSTLLARFCRKEKIGISDCDFDFLLFSVSISIYRRRFGHEIAYSGSEMMELCSKEKYALSLRLSNMLEKELQIGIGEQEEYFIARTFLGISVYKEGRELNRDDEYKAFQPFIDELLRLISNVVDRNLLFDKKLVCDLLQIVPSIIYRNQYKIIQLQPTNSGPQHVKNVYPEIFAAAWSCNVLFQQYYGIDLTQEETGNIALYVAAALERLNYQARVLIIWDSHNGMEETVLLRSRLNRAFPLLEIIDIIPWFQKYAKLYLPDQYDFILSNHIWKNSVKPIIKVDPPLTNKQILEISHLIRRLLKQQYKNTRPEETIEFLLKPEHIFLRVHVKTKEEALRLLCDALEKSGDVTSEYYVSVLKREKVSSTDIGHDVAVSHGNPKFVKHSKLAIAQLDLPILWGNSRVEWIFLCAFNMDQLEKAGIEIDDFYASFIDLIHQDQIAEHFISITDPKSFYNDFVACFKRGKKL